MPLFPLFIDLRGKKCIVVGGGNVAARKIEALIGFEADITVISPEVTDRIKELEQAGELSVIPRGYRGDDLEEAFLAIAATSDRQTNERVYSEAARKNILVNVADNGSKCTFIFPSLVKRNDLVIGISTSRGYPSLSKKVRQEVESAVPEAYGDLLELLKAFRSRVEAEVEDREERKAMLNRIVNEAFNSDGMVPLEKTKSRIEELFGEVSDEKID